MQDYRSLNVWCEGKALAIEIYGLTAEFPREEKYGLASQMRRASVSITSNIAEGCARSGSKELAHFLSIARGSAFELESQLDIAAALGLVATDHPATGRCNSLKRMISALIERVATGSTDN